MTAVTQLAKWWRLAMNMQTDQSKCLLEVCIASVEDAIAADSGGADRLEVNTALELGGLTPTTALLEEAKRETSLPLMAMVRARPAGFHYSQRELQLMSREADQLLAAGADGLVFGCLTAEGTIDRGACRNLVRMCGQRSAVFHRAFDVISDPSAALEQLIDLGFRRLLTSGCADSAVQGCELIANLQRQARGRITIMPGAGIREDNLLEVIHRTGCGEIHGSFRSEFFDNAGPVGSRRYWRTDMNKVRRVRELLSRIEY